MEKQSSISDADFGRCKGALPQSLQGVNEKVFSEWLPALHDYEFAAGYCVEMYDAPDKYPNGTSGEN